MHSLDSDTAWTTISKVAPAKDQERIAKHMVPMRGTQTALRPLLANSSAFDLHSDFLAETFPDEFEGLDQEGYRELVLGVDRPFASGNLVELTATGASGGSRWGFVVWDTPNQADQTVSLAQAEQVFEALSPMVEALSAEPLVFIAYTDNQRQAAEDWGSLAPFETWDWQQTVDYEAYTEAVAFGTLRLVDVADLEELEEDGLLGWQDVLVFDEAPFDLERVVSGVVTGSRQTGLSHLNVRAASRGTPNCYQHLAQAHLEPYEGLLVRFECGEDRLDIRTADLDEAEAFWEELRPDPVDVVGPDLETLALVPLLDLPTDSADDREANVAAYGAKGANLGLLYQRISTHLQLEGFVVPMSAYAAHMAQEAPPMDGAPEGASFQEVVDVWFADEDFLSRADLRRARLDDLREAIREAPVDEALLLDLSEQIEAQWGDDSAMVRFRSSSNAEDALAFSGAGLYDSTSACVADEWDDDEEGPSHCDADQAKERTLSRALGKVWASTWNMAAVEERDWYGIEHHDVAMGVLVNTRSAGEQAEAVVFSGDPVDTSDDRVRVDAQWGEIGVVSPESGVVPEVIRVTVEDGVVVELDWEQDSSEAPDGTPVLSISQAARIGLLVDELDTLLPRDHPVPDGQTLLWDTEWKVLSDGRLVIKQVRPFLR